MRALGYYCIISGVLILACLLVREPHFDHAVVCLLICLTAVAIFFVAKGKW